MTVEDFSLISWKNPAPEWSPQSFPEKLLHARTSRGWSQSEAADHLGVTKWTYGFWERGLQTPQQGQQPLVRLFIGEQLEQETPKTVIEQIAFVRHHRGLSRLRLAELVGVTQLTIKAWEAGGVPRTATHLAALLALVEECQTASASPGSGQRATDRECA